VVVIGGGPGGYPAAIRASQEGARVALVEEDKLGGECTNYGCVPVKTLVRYARSARILARLITLASSSGDPFTEALSEARRVSMEVSSGINMLLRGYGVDVYPGRAVFDRDGRLVVSGYVLKARSYVIAAGSEPSTIPGVSVDGEQVHDNRTILKLESKPSSIVIVGGGYVGVEYAYIMASLGVDVTLVEALGRILPGMDPDISRVVARSLRRLGVRILTNAGVRRVERGVDGVRVETPTGWVEAEKALIAVGRRPRTRGLGLEYIGVEVDDRGYVRVDASMRTSNPSVYASGDVVGPPLLAHKAMMQAEVAGYNASRGAHARLDLKVVPSIVFLEAEVLSIGYTLEEAEELGYKASSIRYPIGGLARARIEGVVDGFVKIVFDEASHRILGLHIVAPGASELAGEAHLLITRGLRLEDLAEVLHPHPTISEALREAALLALKKPVHYLVRSRKP